MNFLDMDLNTINQYAVSGQPIVFKCNYDSNIEYLAGSEHNYLNNNKDKIILFSISCVAIIYNKFNKIVFLSSQQKDNNSIINRACRSINSETIGCSVSITYIAHEYNELILKTYAFKKGDKDFYVDSNRLFYLDGCDILNLHSINTPTSHTKKRFEGYIGFHRYEAESIIRLYNHLNEF